jgi:hypothetical protein
LRGGISRDREDFIMKLAHNVRDYSNTTDVFCNGIASITDLGGGVIRVAFYSVKEEDDERISIIVDQQIWSAAAFLDAVHSAAAAWQEMTAAKRPKVVAVGMH